MISKRTLIARKIVEVSLVQVRVLVLIKLLALPYARGPLLDSELQLSESDKSEHKLVYMMLQG